MCLVEIVGSPKPQASCAFPVSQGMKVYTDTPLVKKARERVMEFLLLNHPLDCPICDQGGECDRQDESMGFGLDRSRGHGLGGHHVEPKRGVEDRDWNPRVKAIITRCIHCTRCIRFSSEIAGVSDRGTSGRGVATEVGTYVEKNRRTELSGNLIDLCPVGALTSKSYGFKARPWELKSVDTVNPRDGIGTSIRLQSRDQRLLRILPLEDDTLNGAWIDDKSRYSLDGAQTDQLGRRRIRGGEEPVDAGYASQRFQDSRVKALEKREEVLLMYHSGLPLEVQGNLGDWVVSRRKLGRNVHPYARGSQEHTGQGSDQREHANGRQGRMDSMETLAGRDALGRSDLILRCGVNRRTELPLVNARVRESYLRDQVQVLSMGSRRDLTFPVVHLGTTEGSLQSRLTGQHPVSFIRSQAKRPRILVGSEAKDDRLGGFTRRASQLKDYGSVETGWKVMNRVFSSSSGMSSHVLGVTDLSSYSSQLKSRGHRPFHLITVGLDQQDLVENGVQRPSPLASYCYLGHHMDPRVSLSSLAIPRPSWYEWQGHRMGRTGAVKALVSASPSLTGSEFDDKDPFALGRGANLPRIESSPWRTHSVMETSCLPTLKTKGMSRLSSAQATSWTPRVYDYHLDGHPVSRRSSRMHACSVFIGSDSNLG